MGCFLACFGSVKDRKRTNRRSDNVHPPDIVSLDCLFILFQVCCCNFPVNWRTKEGKRRMNPDSCSWFLASISYLIFLFSFVKP